MKEMEFQNRYESHTPFHIYGVNVLTPHGAETARDPHHVEAYHARLFFIDRFGGLQDTRILGGGNRYFAETASMSGTKPMTETELEQFFQRFLDRLYDFDHTGRSGVSLFMPWIPEVPPQESEERKKLKPILIQDLRRYHQLAIQKLPMEREVYEHGLDLLPGSRTW